MESWTGKKNCILYSRNLYNKNNTLVSGREYRTDHLGKRRPHLIHDKGRERTENRCKSGHECLYGSHAQPKRRKGAHERQSRIGTCTQLDFCADRARNTQGSSMAVVQIHWLSLWQLSLPHFKCGKTAAQSAVKGCRIGWETALVRAQSMAVRG